MDSGPGQCWVCDAPGKLWCPGCRFALYCSVGCQKRDKARHLDECFNSSRRKSPCSNCGKEEVLGGVPCPNCLVCFYCGDSCRKIDAKNHVPVCQKAKGKVLEAAKKIGEWNRRAKGIPQYLGRLIHAVDYLRWADNEGSKVQTTSGNETSKNKRADKEDPRREPRRGRRSTSGEAPPEIEEQTLRLLILGADLKHVLRTLHDTPDSCTQGIEITLLDSSPHIMARDLLVLYLLMLPDAPTPLQDQSMLKTHAERVVMVFYSLCLDMETHALLCNTLHNLLNLTYKSFLHEMRQQVHIDAVTYTLVQAVWSGWMSFANDPSAMQKLEKIRALKMSGTVIKDVLARYMKSCPKEHQKGITDWIKRGSMKKQKGCYFPNVTLTCFSPLKKEHLDRFEDVNPKWSEETDWIRAVSPDEDMIYAPHGIDMIFQDWDFVFVSKNTRKESNVIEMYLKFLTKVFKKSSQKLLRSNQISINFLRANVKDLRKSPSLLKGKFDRIATGIHADLLGTPLVLQELGVFLSTSNTYARLITHHRVWALCLNWQQDQQAREMYHKVAKSNKPPDPTLMLSARWSTFRHFLQAELLHHLHFIDGRPLEVGNVLPFRDVSHAYDMILSDYTHHLNRIIPFRFRPEKRMVSMVDSRLHTLEWRRVGRSRSSSAPAAALPKALARIDMDSTSQNIDSTLQSKNTKVPPMQTKSGGNPGSAICSREGSLSPSLNDQSERHERTSRSRSTKTQRPKSLYVPSGCKSPLSSQESDFWEQQTLMSEKKNKKKTHYSEIPEGIKTRAQKSLEAELRQSNMKAKSAPASPQTKCKSYTVKEKADAFERGSATRSTYPETRKHIDTITPTTPVKKLVLMFSKAFAAKDKSSEFPKPFTRRNTFHARQLSFEQGDVPGTMPKEYTNSLKKSKARNAVESGMCTLPRNSRPHSIAVSKFSYLEGNIDKDEDLVDKGTKDQQEKEKKKKEVKKTTNLSLPEDVHQSRKEHKSPIRSFIAGLNTLSMSPVISRTSKQSKKALKDTITVKHDELRLVNLRPGSPRLTTPVPGSPTFDEIETIDWPESHSSLSLDTSTEKKTPIDSPRKSPITSPKRSPFSSPPLSPVDSPRKTLLDSPRSFATDSPRNISIENTKKMSVENLQMTPSDSPRIKAESPLTVRSVSPSLSISSVSSNFKKSIKIIPQEPEYVAPPLCISKSPTIMLHAPSSENLAADHYQTSPEYSKYSSLITPSLYDCQKIRRLEDIFSPKPSPTHSRENLHQAQETDAQALEILPSSGFLVQTIKPDIENKAIKETRGASEVETTEKGVKMSTQGEQGDANNIDVEVLESTVKDENTVLKENLIEIISAPELQSLDKEDQEVSELLPENEYFVPINQKDDSSCKDSDIEQDISERSPEISQSSPVQESQCLTVAGIEEEHQIISEIQSTNSVTSGSSEPEPAEYEVNSCSSSKSESPPIIEQLSPPVYKMVEHFAQRIQAEEHMSERPASPKSYNVMKQSSQSKMNIKQQPLDREKEHLRQLEMKNISNELPGGEYSAVPARVISVDLRTNTRKTDIQENQSTKTNCQEKLSTLSDTMSKGRAECLSDAGKLSLLNEESSVQVMNDSYELHSTEETKASCTPTGDVFQVESDLQQEATLGSTSHEELSNTPVNKMVEKFALEIQAQALPPSPKTNRPHSIGTLIQEDFLRLYSDKPLGDEDKNDDDTQEDFSLTSDCCEETMFDISDDEELKTGDIGTGSERLVESKSNDAEKSEDIVEDNGMKLKLEPKGEEMALIDAPSPSTIISKEATKIAPDRDDEICTTDGDDIPSPRESRSSELRHEFLQKIRGINDSPIPPSKKKYGEIKATLNKRKNSMMQGDKLFVDDVSNLRAMTSSPRLEDMAIVSYTVKIEEESITDRLRTPPITPRDEPGGAISVLADKENQGIDGDSQELCSSELKRVEDILDILSSSSSRNESPAQNSPRFYTLPRKSKSGQTNSTTSSLKRLSGKKKVVDSDLSEHKVQMLKSSRTGGMDKISFRNFVKASIASEDQSVVEQTANIIDNDSQVVEFTSSTEVSPELQSNSEEVEEAIEAIALTSDDEPVTVHKKKFTLYSDDSAVSDESNEGLENYQRGKSPSVVIRRKRLPSSRSPSDIMSHGECFLAQRKYSTDDSDNAEGNIRITEQAKTSRDNNLQSKGNGSRDHLRLSPLELFYDDATKKSPDGVGLNFNVEIPDTPVATNKDIRRFMWGSLKRKSKTVKSEDQKQISDIAATQKPILSEPEGSEPKTSETNRSSNTPQYSVARQKKNDKRETKSSNLDTTTPTIVAMLPKHRAGSPIVGLRLSQEGMIKSKSPPKPPPKPKRNSADKAVSQSAEDFASAEILSENDESGDLHKNSVITERPKSWGGIDSPDVIEALTELESISDDFIELLPQEEPEDASDISQPECSEVFCGVHPFADSDDKQQEGSEEKVEVRPKAGVLKNGRDHSRESRRSLRVSWGDLPERSDTPSPSTDDQAETNEPEDPHEQNDEEESDVDDNETGDDNDGHEDDYRSLNVTQL